MKLRQFAILASVFLTACSSEPEHAPAIGEAFIGPSALVLRKAIDNKSAGVGTVHHGDHVDIIGQRRMWYKVRTATGVEGWTDDRQLLDAAQMSRLRKLAAETSGLPSQGKATTFDILNVHVEPGRTSPSFVQVKEKEVFDVIARRVTVRAAKPPKRELVKSTPKQPPPAKKAKSKKNTSKYTSADVPLPASPAAPAPPVDWIALSKERGSEDATNAPPEAHDDWTLIRTSTGQSGWVLTSRVYMSIPDDVAQYAEGHRITSYFSIGSVEDRGERKDFWVWTTAESLGADYDFDSYRVFTWNRARHHYETALIQRRMRGYLPVIAKPGEFSVCVEDKTGARVRRSYTLVDNRIRPLDVKPCEVVAEIGAPVAAKPIELHAPVTQPKQNLWMRLTSRVRSFFGKH